MQACAARCFGYTGHLWICYDLTMQEHGVIVGLDIGDARTGIARSDALQMLAFPHVVVKAATESEMVTAVADEIKRIGPVLVVAGLPLNQHGDSGLQAKRVQSILARLRAVIDVEIVTQDERFSTAEAQRVAQQMQAGRKARKGKIDKIAATLILQTWLDRRASRRNLER